MRVEVEIPFLITKEGINLAHSGVLALIAPREAPILKMDLIELASMKSIAKSIETPSIHISITLVSSSIDLVEITKDKPFLPQRRLLSDQLKEEVIFAGVGGRSVHGGKLEGDPRLPDKDQSGEAKLGGNHIRDKHGAVIPQQKDSTSSADSGALSETL
jgi:hypothetical protein